MLVPVSELLSAAASDLRRFYESAVTRFSADLFAVGLEPDACIQLSKAVISDQVVIGAD